MKKTLHELWKGQKPKIFYFPPFGCKCFILNTKDQLGEVDTKAENGILLGYSDRSKVFRVYNSCTLTVEESIHVKFDDKKPEKELSELDETFADLNLNDKDQIQQPRMKSQWKIKIMRPLHNRMCNNKGIGRSPIS